MKVLLQDCKSLRYLCADNRWTLETSEALAFENSVQALHAARGQGLNLFQIVLKFDQDQYDVHLARSAGC